LSPIASLPHLTDAAMHRSDIGEKPACWFSFAQVLVVGVRRLGIRDAQEPEQTPFV
jgi:hypothetical protein